MGEPQPGVAPDAEPGVDEVELVVRGERFLVSQRAGSPGTYDFTWLTHPTRYGFGVSGTDRNRSTDELRTLIEGFLLEIDPATGYLGD